VPHLIALDPASLDDTSIPAPPSARWIAGAYVANELTGFVSTRDGLFDGCVETTLFVRIRWRRQGIGTFLLKAAMEWALTNEASALRLVCERKDWPMRHFAEKCGARLDLTFGQIVADIPLG
jgi:GNAT superfamily N-acetyltransferase